MARSQTEVEEDRRRSVEVVANDTTNATVRRQQATTLPAPSTNSHTTNQASRNSTNSTTATFDCKQTRSILTSVP